LVIGLAPYAWSVNSHGSRFWHAAFNLQYRILAVTDPIIRRTWRGRGIGNVVELEVARRQQPQTTRRRLVGVLHANGHSYIGHPNGDVGWTRDLAAAATGVLRYHEGTTWRFAATRLADGIEREQVIRSTGQHPFPGNLTYRLGRRQVRAVGVYFRLSDAETVLSPGAG
jgi:hypothetical protein